MLNTSAGIQAHRHAFCCIYTPPARPAGRPRTVATTCLLATTAVPSLSALSWPKRPRTQDRSGLRCMHAVLILVYIRLTRRLQCYSLLVCIWSISVRKLVTRTNGLPRRRVRVRAACASRQRQRLAAASFLWWHAFRPNFHRLAPLSFKYVNDVGRYLFLHASTLPTLRQGRLHLHKHFGQSRRFKT